VKYKEKNATIKIVFPCNFGITNQFTEVDGLFEHEIRGILNTLTLSTASTGSAILYFYTRF
jgi:hypothetical protein